MIEMRSPIRATVFIADGESVFPLHEKYYLLRALRASA
jgi:hypothetical protein